MRKNRFASAKTLVQLAWLFCLLAVSAEIGSRRDGINKTIVAQKMILHDETWTGYMSGDSLDAVRERLRQSRERELSLLDEVISSADDIAIKETAVSQKAEAVRRFSAESTAEAVLAAMGCKEAVASMGGGILTIFIRNDSFESENDRLSLFDALCQQTGMPAESVKMILIKSET